MKLALCVITLVRVKLIKIPKTVSSRAKNSTKITTNETVNPVSSVQSAENLQKICRK